MGTIQLKFKTLVKQMSFLKADLEYHKAEHQKRRKLFYSDLSKFMETGKFETSEEKVKKNLIEVYKREKTVEVPKLKQQSKSLFKKVAKLTHPDVNKEEEKHKLFREAKKAVENDDWFSMYEISTDLGVELDSVGQEHIDWLEQETRKLQKMINGIKDTFEWIYSNEGANKEQLLTTYCMMTCKIQNVE
tara:strand:- start:676 stop:1242 length:567 start_codon:yes stop_codon:yes gene_type:complete